jgi:hypothetical protein
LTFVVLVALAACSTPLASHLEPPAPAVDAAAVVAELSERIEATYVFPEKVPAIVAALEAGRDAGRYDGADLAAVAQALTDDLVAASADLHFTIFSEDDAPPPRDPSPDGLRLQREAWRRDNNGFHRVEVLDGNVGLIEMSAFGPPAMAGDTAEAALRFVAGTDALIFDLRSSSGGDPQMVGLLLAHLHDGEPFLFNRFYWRPTDAMMEWVTPAVDPPLYPDRPVFVLTSKTTPSAAEGFSYHLKHLGRATLVGETTAGAAHPVTTPHLDSAPLVAYLPSGRAISPITGTNWEGVGVIPHHEVPAAEALAVAHGMAIDRVLEGLGEGEEKWRNELVEVRKGLPAAPAATEEKSATPAG